MDSRYYPLSGDKLPTHHPAQSNHKRLVIMSMIILIFLPTFAWISSQKVKTPFQSKVEIHGIPDGKGDTVTKETEKLKNLFSSWLVSPGVNEIEQKKADDFIVDLFDETKAPWEAFSPQSFSYSVEEQIYSYSYAESEQTESHSATSNHTSSPLPNVVFFLADDQGFADLGYTAESSGFSAFTPFIDDLAANGIKLSNYYTEHLCTPARASLLTGKHPIHNGMQYLVVDTDSPFGLPLQHKTLAQYLGNIGFQTHIVGKWHLGHFNKHYLPLSRGFMSQIGYYTDHCDYYLHDIDEIDAYFTDFHMNELPYDTKEYSLSVYISKVEDILQNHDTSHPLFLYYAQQAPHTPLEEPPTNLVGEHILETADALFPEHEHQRTFAKMTAALDKSVQHLIEQLKKNDLYENTIFIYASDNGGCSAFGANNYPLRGQKNSLYEGGVRVNAFIHSPLIPEDLRGSSFNQLFHVVDWLPTIFHGILGQESLIFDLDGINQWGNIIENTDDYRLEMVHNIEVHRSFPYSFRGAVRVGNYKLIYGQDDDGWYNSTSVSSCESCCEQVTDAFPRRTQVYDIEKDMRETQNMYSTIDDEILSVLWEKLDGYWDTMVNSAYKTEDTGAYEFWGENGMYVAPWITDP